MHFSYLALFCCIHYRKKITHVPLFQVLSRYWYRLLFHQIVVEHNIVWTVDLNILSLLRRYIVNSPTIVQLLKQSDCCYKLFQVVLRYEILRSVVTRYCRSPYSHNMLIKFPKVNRGITEMLIVRLYLRLSLTHVTPLKSKATTHPSMGIPSHWDDDIHDTSPSLAQYIPSSLLAHRRMGPSGIHISSRRFFFSWTQRLTQPIGDEPMPCGAMGPPLHAPPAAE